MRGETEEQFRLRMEKKAQRARYFISLEEQAAVAALEARKDRKTKAQGAAVEKEKQLAVKAAQRGSTGERSTRRSAKVGTTNENKRRSAAAHAKPKLTRRRDVPLNCIQCGRTMRTKARGREVGEVAHEAGGRCVQCSRGIRKPRTSSYPKACTGGCGTQLRPSSETLVDFPGTKAHYSNGMCRPCAMQAAGRSTRSTFEGPVIRLCAGTCGRMTRPAARKKDDAPGTVPRVRDGRCATCLRGRDG